MDDDDIAWSNTAGSFKYRSAAVIRDDDRVLVCAVEHIDGWFLPGGKVHFGEQSAAALVRELREEIGLDIAVTASPILITESIREQDGLLHQEVCFYYDVRWPEAVPAGSVHDLAGHRFRWVSRADLAGLGFLPPEIAGFLTERATEPRHMAFDRRSRAAR